ncbi:hypothetical protein DRJ19_00645 [Candidatus Woesearchaeota archaeon]|nr:MAG: hypothetical protein DRJ19_00645 [Candidatus Woesearchaeota archaeon]
MLAKKPPEGKYYRLKSIHGELPVRRRAPPQPTPPEGFMGYVKTPEGWKIKTPFFEIPVEKIPQTADSVLTVHERPIRAFLTTIDLASPTFRQEISKAFERVRRIRELIRL